MRESAEAASRPRRAAAGRPVPFYDSMICKLICHGRNRQEAIQRMNRSLDEFVIEGIDTTIPLHKKLLNHNKFLKSDFNVSWLDKEKII